MQPQDLAARVHALIDLLRESKRKHHGRCHAYGNYQPPYEECNCGADEWNERVEAALAAAPPSDRATDAQHDSRQHLADETVSVDKACDRHATYTSTACQHGLHGRCRQACKFCLKPCDCVCHAALAAALAPKTFFADELVAAMNEERWKDATFLLIDKLDSVYKQLPAAALAPHPEQAE